MAAPVDRRAARRQATVQEIVDAAWALAREQGLAGITMRDLGARVGMKAQSLYSYFTSKHDLYDAMFLQGYGAFAAWMDATTVGEGVERARQASHRYFEFCVRDPVRFQLLFQRTIPGFQPSPASYEAAVRMLAHLTAELAALGVEGGEQVDMWTAVLTGLASQQIANDPGGTRWERLVDDAVDMLLAQVTAGDHPNPRRSITAHARTRSPR